ncbi:MAG: diacylglycerol kinase family lipid kinase [Clostridia bacterium]|nr:diacylglycerol kinase family lipid kinase [Clostridia bacterium]
MSAITWIINPTAGAGLAQSVEERLRAELERRGLEADFVHTEHPGHGEELARRAAQNGAQTVVSVGGDGSNLEAARGLFGTRTALGLIPAGTGNDLIKTLGIPKDPMEALEWLLSHPARPMDVGTVNGRLFLNVCGTGFDVAVLDSTEKFKKRFHGLLPYLLGLITAISHNRPVQVEMTLPDGRREEKALLLCSVANGRWIGGGIPVCPAAEISDGLLDLVEVQNVPNRRIPRYLPGLMRGKILTFPITQHRRVSGLRLRSPGMRLQIDGEIVPMDEAEFAVHPGGILIHA